MNPKQIIFEKLQSLGFSSVAVSSVELDFHEDAYQSYLEKNYHGEMEYLQTHLPFKLNPELLLEGLRSVIVASYPCSPPQEKLAKQDYKIASYAYGRDYHRILKKHRKVFYKFFSEAFPQAKIYGTSDSGPLLEKAWAKRSGLAWMGKHSNMIQNKTGSYFFLNLFLTDLELAPDQAQSNHCGTCCACQDICPTSAILDDSIVDGSRCISYLTIEYKGVIPRDLRSKIGEHLFGCDDCQSICPWNRFASSDCVDPDLLWQREELSLLDLAYLSREEFAQHFQASPLLRSKYEGFLRNLAIVMGNSGQAKYCDALLYLLQSDYEIVRVHALWGLSELDLVQAQSWVEQHRAQEKNPFILTEMDAVDLQKNLR